MPNGPELRPSQRKIREQAAVLLIAGIVLLLPPVAHIFLLDGIFAGVPIPVFYVFAVWILLIAGTARFSRRLQEGDDADPEPESGESPS